MMLTPRHVLLALENYDHRIHRGAARYAGQHRWHLNTVMFDQSRIPFGWQGDGILTALGSGAELARFVNAARVPIVDLSLTRNDLPLPRVVGDHQAIGRLAAEHFLERGFRHFAWVTSHFGPVPEQRWAGYSAALARARFHPERWIWQPKPRRVKDDWPARCRWLIEKLLAIAKPAAVFAFRDADAANVLDACLTAGLRVPDDVAILGVDNNDLICETPNVPLSSVQHDLERLGYDGAALLDRLMSGEPPPKAPILIPPRGVIIRQSTNVLAVADASCRRALQFIRDGFSRPIGVVEIARASGLSVRSIEKSFRQHLGRTVAEDLRLCRLAKSKELLLGTRLPIADIAARTGFQTPQYFNTAFRKATGLTPRKFRLAQEFSPIVNRKPRRETRQRETS